MNEMIIMVLAIVAISLGLGTLLFMMLWKRGVKNTSARSSQYITLPLPVHEKTNQKLNAP